METRVEWFPNEKADLPPGPRQSEPDKKQWPDPATGLPCLAVRSFHMGSWCGYVAVPPGHPLHGKDYSEVDLGVHGGLTFSSSCGDRICHAPAPGEPDDVWWFGFDCGHLGDFMPRMPGLLGPDDVYRDLAFIERECACLAAQLAEEAS